MSELTQLQARLDDIGGLLDEQYEELSEALDTLSPSNTIVWDAMIRDRGLTETEKAKLKAHLKAIDGIIKGIRKRQKQIRKHIDRC